MKRRKRAIYRAASLGVICIVCVAAWIRSFYHADTLFYCRGSYVFAAGFSPGALVLMGGNTLDSGYADGLHFRGPPWRPHGGRNVDPLAPTLETTSGFGWAGPGTELLVSRSRGPMVRSDESMYHLWHGYAVAVPFWLLSLAAGAGTVWAAYAGRRRPGRCAECGYDLRGMADGAVGPCPECGNRPESAGNPRETSPRDSDR